MIVIVRKGYEAVIWPKAGFVVAADSPFSRMVPPTAGALSAAEGYRHIHVGIIFDEGHEAFTGFGVYRGRAVRLLRVETRQCFIPFLSADTTAHRCSPHIFGVNPLRMLAEGLFRLLSRDFPGFFH